MPPKMKPFEERLWPKIDRRGPDECWLWLASTLPGGYGQISRGGRGNGMVRAHRAVYELLAGPIPAGTELDHLCRNPRCCNPAHLDPVTHPENCRRGDGWSGKNARKTHCVHGHAYTPENTVFTKGGRRCRECARLLQRPQYAERQRAYVPKPRKATAIH